MKKLHNWRDHSFWLLGWIGGVVAGATDGRVAVGVYFLAAVLFLVLRVYWTVQENETQ